MNVSRKIQNSAPLVLFLLILLFSCSGRKHKADISGIEIGDIDVRRYDSALFAIDPGEIASGLKILAPEFPIFIGEGYKDTMNIIQIRDFITDPFIMNIKDACWTQYKDLSWLPVDLKTLFSYTRYYFPEFQPPVVYTYISGLLFESPVNYVDSSLLIALDMYLGQQFAGYRQVGIPVYLTKRMEKSYLMADVARQIAISEIPADKPPATLLDYMVYHGKILYFMDLVMSDADDTLKIGYTGKQMDWALENEETIWAFLIDKELLYSHAYFEINKFIQDGPFTNGLPKESPAMLGRWLGWQIVRHYMDNNPGITLKELFEESDSQKILSQSGYKPRAR